MSDKVIKPFCLGKFNKRNKEKFLKGLCVKFFNRLLLFDLVNKEIERKEVSLTY